LTNHVAKLDNNNDSDTVHLDKEHVRSVSSTCLAPTQEQEGRHQLEACTLSNGKPGNKCVGVRAPFMNNLNVMNCSKSPGTNLRPYSASTGSIGGGRLARLVQGFWTCRPALAITSLE
jgi:hypothetical protein